jgi:hypothetical protein
MASRTDADIRRAFARLEGVNERVHYESMVNMFGRKAVESTEVLFLMDGMVYLLRSLALPNILQKNTTQISDGCTGVESSPVTSLTVTNGAVEPCASRIL